MRIGIFGGTFDPVHFGHLRVAEEICQELDLEKVYLVPSAHPPHKQIEDHTSFRHRLNMARMGAALSPLLDVLDIEGKRPGFSYSITTLKELNRIFHPAPELFFILGTDAFLEIETWKDYAELFDLANFVVIQRAGYEAEDLAPLIRRIRPDMIEPGEGGGFLTPSGNKVLVMEVSSLLISSTAIREAVAGSRSIRFLVPEAVRNYILQQGLYGSR